MSPAPSARRRRQRLRNAVVALGVGAAHAMLVLHMLHDLQPPSTKGDGTSSHMAMMVALAPFSISDDPKSQGADSQTRSTDQAAAATGPDETLEAQGAGAAPDVDPGGGEHRDIAKVEAQVQTGGGGGTKDDPWSRASLTPELDTTAAFDLTARNEALFRSRVQSCLPRDTGSLDGVTIAVSLATDGQVEQATPVRGGPGAPAVGVAPTATEKAALRALHACAPYRDLVLGRTPVLRYTSPTPKTVASTS